VELVKFQK